MTPQTTNTTEALIEAMANALRVILYDNQISAWLSQHNVTLKLAATEALNHHLDKRFMATGTMARALSRLLKYQPFTRWMAKHDPKALDQTWHALAAFTGRPADPNRVTAMADALRAILHRDAIDGWLIEHNHSLEIKASEALSQYLQQQPAPAYSMQKARTALVRNNPFTSWLEQNHPHVLQQALDALR